MIKLIASDLDGTLLQNGSRQVPPEFIETIKECKKKGILFAAASGRQYASLQRLFAEVKDDIAYICENGAVTIYQGQVLHQSVIDRTIANEIIQKIIAEDGSHALVSGAFTSYIDGKDKDLEARLHSNGNHVVILPDLLQVEEPIVKLAIYEKEGTEERNRGAYWQPKMPFPARVATSGALWLDVLFPDANKGIGMRALAERLHLEKEEIMCFGDNQNDMEMFAESGIPVAMENAKPEVLAASKYVTSSVNEFVRKYCL